MLLALSTQLSAFARRFGHGLAGGTLLAAAWTLLIGRLGYWRPVEGLLLGLVASAGVWAWLRARGPEQSAGLAFLTAIALVFEGIVFGFFARVFRNFLTLEELGALDLDALRLALVEQLLRLVFSLSISLLFTSMTSAALSGIYLSDRAALALLAPRHWLLNFFERFFATALSVSYMVLGLLVPALLALGWRFGAKPAFYWLLPAALLLLLLPPLALGAGVTALLIRLFPVDRLQQLLSLVTVLAIAAIVILVRAASPEKLYNPDSSADLAEIARSINVSGLDRLPGAWTARLLVRGLDGELSTRALVPLLVTAAIALAALAALAAAYGRLHARAQERTSALRPSSGWWPRGRSALLWLKDARLFTRDAKEWSQVVMLAALVVVYLYNIQKISTPTPFFRIFVLGLNLTTLGFILTALNMRFTFPAMALEGPGLWVLLKSPLGRDRILLGKTLFSFLPLSGFALLLTALAGRLMQLPPPLFRLSMALSAIFAVTLHWMALAAGIAQYRPPEADPVRMALSPGGIGYMVGSLAYVALGLALVGRMIWTILNGGAYRSAAPLLALAAVSALIVLGCELFARRRLAAMEW